jgi:hypothetical protein
MTLFDFEELTRYWTEHPPVHLLVGGYLGIGKRPHRTKQMPVAGSDHADLEALLAELGPGFGAGDVHAGLDAVVLDFPELRRRVRAGK